MQIVLGFLTAFSLVLYWRSWRDLAHLFYDIPAALAMGAYLGQTACELKERLFSRQLWIRLVLLVPMSVIPAGRDLYEWNISGHLMGILTVALIQAVDARLYVWEKLAYGFPLPIILWIRLFQFDKKGHAETLNAIGVALLLFVCYFVTRNQKS